ncbi:DUF421 domain-containing protein [Paenibacillus sp. CMAA1739]|uniref:DUF421 domain-containing protein n=1 Tax=Paenibacillus ottowii TaxID=2315729 RepID=UPI00273113C4|nr:MULTISPECIES: YetF domain-containing protein [Paenibacillus]MDP1513187.1 DUF421 domain-containing protein [Paenibacillus ottowii]MEC4569095.1 DUF421 domain-containing protein [Paenibacillus sp. CMAA1739]
MWIIVWSTILLACIGTLFLRIAGRKSISQMTIPQVMILLAIGTVLGSEVSGKGMTNTILALGTFILFLIVVEWITLRSNRIESILKGKSVSVIHEGKLEIDNLRRLRVSVDDLEKRLRMVGIKDMELMLKTYLPQLKSDVSGVERISFEGDQTEPHRDEVPTHLQ